MTLNNNQRAFFELLKAGLWGIGNSKLRINESLDWEGVQLISQEQSVQSLILQGLEWHIKQGTINKTDIPQGMLLQWIGEVQIIEQQNLSMNEFVAKLIEKLRKEDVYAILIKGQGIAQCYERPLWRVSGDIDLLLSDANYEKAKEVLVPLATDVESEYKLFKHLGMTMPGGFVVELHGTLHSRLSRRVDKVIDNAQKDVFLSGNVRLWQNGNTQVFLPSPDNDVIFIFTHILHHFFIGGVGLRQICDWCRLLWTYKDSLNYRLLESRIRKSGLMTEWKAFAAFAIDYLGMPKEAMLLYSADTRWSRKADRIISFISETGNFGHNRQVAGRKINSAWRKTMDFVRHTRLFPLDSVKFLGHFMWNGIKLAIHA